MWRCDKVEINGVARASGGVTPIGSPESRCRGAGRQGGPDPALRVWVAEQQEESPSGKSMEFVLSFLRHPDATGLLLGPLWQPLPPFLSPNCIDEAFLPYLRSRASGIGVTKQSLGTRKRMEAHNREAYH